MERWVDQSKLESHLTSERGHQPSQSTGQRTGSDFSVSFLSVCGLGGLLDNVVWFPAPEGLQRVWKDWTDSDWGQKQTKSCRCWEVVQLRINPSLQGNPALADGTNKVEKREEEGKGSSGGTTNLSHTHTHWYLYMPALTEGISLLGPSERRQNNWTLELYWNQRQWI